MAVLSLDSDYRGGPFWDHFGTRRNRRNFFSPENGVMLCVQPLTITREPGGKYPSQHDHLPLHGELGER